MAVKNLLGGIPGLYGIYTDYLALNFDATQVFLSVNMMGSRKAWPFLFCIHSFPELFQDCCRFYRLQMCKSFVLEHIFFAFCQNLPPPDLVNFFTVLYSRHCIFSSLYRFPGPVKKINHSFSWTFKYIRRKFHDFQGPGKRL